MPCAYELEKMDRRRKELSFSSCLGQLEGHKLVLWGLTKSHGVGPAEGFGEQGKSDIHQEEEGELAKWVVVGW